VKSDIVSNIGYIPVLGYQSFWKNKYSSFKSEHPILVQQYPDEDVQLIQLFKVPGVIEEVVGHTPASVGEVWNMLPL
jgi:hypothetical protein